MSVPLYSALTIHIAADGLFYFSYEIKILGKKGKRPLQGAVVLKISLGPLLCSKSKFTYIVCLALCDNGLF